MKLGFLRRGIVFTLLASAGTTAGAAVAIDHAGVGCIVAGQFPRFEARLDPAAEVSRARLHFRPAGGPHWYSVAMNIEGGAWSGVLPKPKKTLTKLDYYIEATDKVFGTSRTAEFSPDVSSGPAACQGKLVAGALPSATVVLEAPAGAPLVPLGFEPEGIVAVSGTTGSSGGEAGGTSASSAGTAAGGGLGKTGLLIGGAVAAGAGVAVAVASGGGSSTGRDAPGGGGTGGPATCQSKPITSSIANATTVLRCGQPLAAAIVLTNGSCGPLAVQSVQLTQDAKPGPFCSAAVSQFSYPAGVSSVNAGQTTTVLNFVSAAYCCPGGACPGTTTCTYDQTFVVLTGAGPVGAGTVPVQVSFDPSCPICPP